MAKGKMPAFMMAKFEKGKKDKGSDKGMKEGSKKDMAKDKKMMAFKKGGMAKGKC